MLRNIIVRSVKLIREEELEIGLFSSRDLLRIVFDRIFNLIRGTLLITCRKLKGGWFFVGSNCTIRGLEKMTFSNSLSIGSHVKISSIGSRGFTFGKNFSIKDYSVIDSFGSLKKESGQLTVGNNVGISEYCYFGIRGNLTIMDNVIIGPNVKIFTENHSTELNDIPFRLQNEVRQDVQVGNNVWIGAGSIILPGVRISDNVVVAAGSVVNKNVESFTIVGGVPVKVIKNLK